MIRNAIDMRKYLFSQKIRNEYRNTLGLEGRFVVGHVGRMTYAKNYPFLLDVFACIAAMREDALLLLVGDGPDLPSVKKRVSEIGLGGRVKMLGLRNDVPALLQAMDVFLLPSHFEGLPVVIIEAQATGLPCVGSESIATEAIYTNLVTRLPLNESLEKWAVTVLNQYTDNRCSDLKAIMAGGYELDDEVKRLEVIYNAILKTHEVKQENCLP